MPRTFCSLALLLLLLGASTSLAQDAVLNLPIEDVTVPAYQLTNAKWIYNALPWGPNVENPVTDSTVTDKLFFTWTQTGNVQGTVLLNYAPQFGNPSDAVAHMITLNGFGNSLSCISLASGFSGPENCNLGQAFVFPTSSATPNDLNNYYVIYSRQVLGCTIEGGYVSDDGVMTPLAWRTMQSCQPVRYIGFTAYNGPVYVTNATLSYSLAYLVQPDNVGYTNDVLNVNTTYQIQWSQAGDVQTSLVLTPSTPISIQRYRRGFLPVNWFCKTAQGSPSNCMDTGSCTQFANINSEYRLLSRDEKKNFDFFVSNAYQITLGGWGGQACCARWGSVCQDECIHGVGQPTTLSDVNTRLGTAWWIWDCSGYIDWDDSCVGIPACNYGDQLWQDRVWTRSSNPELLEKPCAPMQPMPRVASAQAQHFWARSAVQPPEPSSTLANIMAGMGPYVDYDSVACAQQFLVSPQKQIHGGGLPINEATEPKSFGDSDNLALNAVAVEKVAFWASQNPVVIRHVAVTQVEGNAIFPSRTMRLITNDSTEFLAAAPREVGLQLTTTDGTATNPFYLEWLVSVSEGTAVVRSQAANFQVAFYWTPSTIGVSTTPMFVNATAPDGDGWKDPMWLVDLSNLESDNKVHLSIFAVLCASPSLLLLHHSRPLLTHTQQHRLRSSTTLHTAPGGWAMQPFPKRCIGGVLASDEHNTWLDGKQLIPLLMKITSLTLKKGKIKTDK